MPKGRRLSPPIYTLPHGIEVIGEYAPSGKNPYWRVRVRPHPFVVGRNVGGGVYTKRCRVMAASLVGRRLGRNEHVHHRNGDKTDDRPENLDVISAAGHNRHHKAGSKHTAEAKRKIGVGLRRAITEGRRLPPPAPDWSGRRHSDESRRRISETRKALIASGAIEKQTPPSFKGRRHSDAAKEKIRQAAIKRRAERRESAT